MLLFPLESMILCSLSILDFNFNRAGEGLHVLEDIGRCIHNSYTIIPQLKIICHVLMVISELLVLNYLSQSNSHHSFSTNKTEKARQRKTAKSQLQLDIPINKIYEKEVIWI